jgi:hypothetical protein
MNITPIIRQKWNCTLWIWDVMIPYKVAHRRSLWFVGPMYRLPAFPLSFFLKSVSFLRQIKLFSCLFFLSFFLSFLIWPLLRTHCRCRGLLLHLLTLNVSLSRSLSLTHTHTHTHTHTRHHSSERVISSLQRPLPENTQHSQETSMPPVGLEPAIPASEPLQTYALDGAANGIDSSCVLQIRSRPSAF